ncbi:acyl-CoA desaturase [Nannocystis sp.]|uniref:acyl-CoA desaturase n=1 Tax=Nannocystis sp. TaxID=1962667 RepID=UPI0025EA5A56|nr:acyl-CoA desaturase [Nannocystis sp.]
MQEPIAIPERFAHLPLPAADRGVYWPGFMPFLGVHLACFAALWTGARPVDWIVCGVLYFLRTFGVMAGYHRYFSHRAFKTSRVFQFVLAFLAETSGQKGVLWWAARHRHHHKFSDLPWDVHSPLQRGFWHSHVGWIAELNTEGTDREVIQDLTRYPELVWLDRHWMFPPLLAGTAVWYAFGWSGLVVGFFLSTVLTWHATFLVNSLAHVVGKRRFATGDTSRNHWLIAVVTLGEGWHNNHHHYMSSARQGFYWWEIDVTYYVLRLLALFGVVWDLRPVPPAVIAEGRARDAACTTRSGG